jgi:sulfate transport system ATP-binding protein
MSVAVLGISRHFQGGKLAAVANATFTAPTGRITALLGPSGSGKTTLLRIIAGLETPDTGTVFLGGHNCTETPAKNRGVGLVFQGYALFGTMSVFENVAFGLRVRAMKRAEVQSRVMELLRLVEMEEHASRFPAQLSGGQKQRVAFARALAIRPCVLLLDEPFSALDTRVRADLRRWLCELHDKTHVTTLLVTHDQEEALEVAQHVVIMEEGRVAQEGTPEDIYDRPANRFVASFLGNAAVLEGRVSKGQADLGGVMVTAPKDAAEGSAVHAFVRPHEVRLYTSPPPGFLCEGVRVRGMRRAGPYVNVSVQLPSEQILSVRIARSEANALRLCVGDRVYLDAHQAMVFRGDVAA